MLAFILSSLALLLIVVLLFLIGRRHRAVGDRVLEEVNQELPKLARTAISGIQRRQKRNAQPPVLRDVSGLVDLTRLSADAKK